MNTQFIKEKSKSYRILSLDGGGAKGFYTLGVLSEIEAVIKRPLCQCFDLIFGTSTGAIIAALLARGEMVDTVRLLYEKHVPVIMKNQSRRARTKALHEKVRAVFQNSTCEVFKTEIGIVATNWKDELPLIFKSSVSRAYGSKGSFQPFFGVTVADAVIASCSAFPFFNRHLVRMSNGDILELADGTFCANDPTLYAIADATVALAHSHGDVRVISLGVGSYPDPPISKVARRLIRNWSLVRHALSSDFLQKMFGTNTRSMEVLMGVLFKDVPTIRINKAFPESDMATDLLEHDLTKLNRLAQKGRSSFREFEEEIRDFMECQNA
jgi:predicted acylesterase/phospholipase RssA